MNIVDKHCFMTEYVRQTVLVFPSYTFAVYIERFASSIEGSLSGV